MTPRTRKLGFEVIREVAKAVASGEPFLSYSEMAQNLGMQNTTGQGLGPILDYAAELCLKHGLPDVTANVVTKSSLDSGNPMPSDNSFDANGMWAISGLYVSDVPNEQKKVIEFDWISVRPLKLQS